MAIAVLGKAGRLTWSQVNTISKEHRVTAASMAPEKTPSNTVACVFTTFLISGHSRATEQFSDAAPSSPLLFTLGAIPHRTQGCLSRVEVGCLILRVDRNTS